MIFVSKKRFTVKMALYGNFIICEINVPKNITRVPECYEFPWKTNHWETSLKYIALFLWMWMNFHRKIEVVP